MRRFFVTPPKEGSLEQFSFEREETRHMQKVLRLSVSDEINVFDGRGNEYRCVIEEFLNKQALARIITQVEPTCPESSLELTLAVALIKGEKFDLVIQKAVELGVTELIPISTIRSDVKAKNIQRKLERWRKIIIEASKQCGRATLMRLSEPSDYDYAVRTSEGSRVLFSEREGVAFSSLEQDKKITALVGPEGGWDDVEIELARNNGFQVVTLGGRILRAETAVISVAALLQNHFGDLN